MAETDYGVIWSLLALGLVVVGLGWALQSYLFGELAQEPWSLTRPEAVKPAVRSLRDFGSHINPLQLNFGVGPLQQCQGSFEQFDARTWQCQQCKLLRFEKP